MKRSRLFSKSRTRSSGTSSRKPRAPAKMLIDLLRERHRLVLRLLEQLGHALAAVETVARALVEVGGELRECRQLAILGEVEAQLPGDLLHRLGLRVTTDAGDREADVDGGPDAGVEEVGLQVDLTVGDRDDVGGDERGDVVRLGLDDRQRGQRAATLLRRSSAPRARAAASADRRRHPGRPRATVDGAAAARARDTRRRAC